MILDTNALSALLDGDPDLGDVLKDASEVCLSPIVLGEYRFGILSSRHCSEYESELDRLESELPTLPLDRNTSAHYGLIRRELRKAGRPIPWHDLWIAAQCRQHLIPILSRDAHFDSVEGITRLAW